MPQIFVWTFGDVVSLVLAGILAVAWLIITVRLWIGRKRCKHDGGIGETSACDAICHKCGKNLGFIGAWRKRA